MEVQALLFCTENLEPRLMTAEILEHTHSPPDTRHLLLSVSSGYQPNDRHAKEPGDED